MHAQTRGGCHKKNGGGTPLLPARRGSTSMQILPATLSFSMTATLVRALIIIAALSPGDSDCARATPFSIAFCTSTALGCKTGTDADETAPFTFI